MTSDPPSGSEPPVAQPTPSFGRWMGALWLYTILRFGLFFVLWGLLLLIGLGGFLAAGLALVLSVPLSFVLLARPRAALARNVEARVDSRRARQADLDARLQGDD
jgi:O-antigen ligase